MTLIEAMRRLIEHPDANEIWAQFTPSGNWISSSPAIIVNPLNDEQIDLSRFRYFCNREWLDVQLKRANQDYNGDRATLEEYFEEYIAILDS